MGNMMYIMVVCNSCKTRDEVFCRQEELDKKLLYEYPCPECGSVDRKKLPFFSAAYFKTTGSTKKLIK